MLLPDHGRDRGHAAGAPDERPDLSYRLVGPDGSPTEGRKSWFRFHTSGASTVRMELEYYRISRAGRYTLHIIGLKPGEEPDPDHRVVFMKSHLARSLVRVVGIVLASMLLIGSVVLFLRRRLSHGNAS